jgi:hypothetical protein
MANVLIVEWDAGNIDISMAVAQPQTAAALLCTAIDCRYRRFLSIQLAEVQVSAYRPVVPAF